MLPESLLASALNDAIPRHRRMVILAEHELRDRSRTSPSGFAWSASLSSVRDEHSDELAENLIRWIGPGIAVGMTCGDWVRLLADNRFRCSPTEYRRRPLPPCSAGADAVAFLEQAIYARHIAAESVQAPLFVLGHWRHGTTHLQNLPAVDEACVSQDL